MYYAQIEVMHGLILSTQVGVLSPLAIALYIYQTPATIYAQQLHNTTVIFILAIV